MNKDEVEVGNQVTVKMGRNSRLNNIQFTVAAKGDFSAQLSFEDERYAIEYHKLRPVN